MFPNRRYLSLLALTLVVVLMCLSCAPGNYRWDQEINPGHKAGFWAGIWHGLIIIIAFIVSLFADKVGVYETSNTGWSYNLGFLIGLFCSVGGGFRVVGRKRRIRKREWDEIGERIEEKVRKGIKSWLDETETGEKQREWEEIASKIEEKIKEAMRKWTEKE